MKIFLDTNVVAEYIEVRSEAQTIMHILETSALGNQFFISEGSFYTLSYLVDKLMRRNNIYNPERVEKDKEILRGVLDLFRVTHAGETGLKTILDDNTFTDLEDGFQYQAALACQADVLLTINIKDFKKANQSLIKIMTPQDFADSYLP